MTHSAQSTTPPLPAEAMLPSPYRVVASRHETADTVTIDLEPVGDRGAAFAPGQFAMVYVFGVGEVPISVSGGGGAGESLSHTVRAVGAVTRAICGLEAGDEVGIRGPYGTPWPLAEAHDKDVVVAAGGIGLAPLRPVVRRLLTDRSRYGTVSLIYGARSPRDLLFGSELQEWRSRFDAEIEVTVDRSDEGWFGDVGVVTGLLPRIAFDPANTLAMVCGPEIMMKVIARELEATGVRPEDVFISLERNMKCAVGFCGHCQYGPDFACRQGPVVPYRRVMERMRVVEL